MKKKRKTAGGKAILKRQLGVILITAANKIVVKSGEEGLF